MGRGPKSKGVFMLLSPQGLSPILKPRTPRSRCPSTGHETSRRSGGQSLLLWEPLSPLFLSKSPGIYPSRLYLRSEVSRRRRSRSKAGEDRPFSQTQDSGFKVVGLGWSKLSSELDTLTPTTGVYRSYHFRLPDTPVNRIRRDRQPGRSLVQRVSDQG